MSTTKIAVRSITRHKARSALTILGIIVGIGLVLSLGSITEGLSYQIQEQLASMAAVVNVDSADDDGITEDMVEEVSNIIGVESAIPTTEYGITRRVRGGQMGAMMRGMGMHSPMGGPGGGGFTSLSFTAIDPENLQYLVDEEINAIEGRKIDDSDDGDYVVLLGYTTAEQQGLNLGDEIEYQKGEDDSESTTSYYFEVIGILEETGGTSIDGAAYVSLSTMQAVEDDDTIESLIVTVTDIELVEQVTEEINTRIEDVRARSFVTIVRQIESTLSSVQMALIAIGAVAVFVGGLGIANTMIMSVMERRRDMGIMKAIGATERKILMKVVTEAVLMSIVGGVGGVVIGFLVAEAMPAITGMTAILTPGLIILGMGFALVLGVGAGIYPAWQASRLDPVEVLQYE